MKTNKITKKDIIKKFGYENAFSAKELFEFYRLNENELKEGTFRWRVSELKKEGLMSNVKRGVYILDHKKKFQPEISRSTKILYNRIKNRFPFIEICVWNTSWLDNFMNHQIYSSYIIFEVDKEVVSSVFNMLKEKKDRVYMNPKKEEVENYILSENAIIINPILKEAPVQDRGNVKVSKLEKILVDLYFDKTLLIAYQGNEMKNIFKRTFEEYEINLTTLYRYARNRGIKDKIKNYIERQLPTT
jgi:hypothetical protein